MARATADCTREMMIPVDVQPSPATTRLAAPGAEFECEPKIGAGAWWPGRWEEREARQRWGMVSRTQRGNLKGGGARRPEEQALLS